MCALGEKLQTTMWRSASGKSTHFTLERGKTKIRCKTNLQKTVALCDFLPLQRKYLLLCAYGRYISALQCSTANSCLLRTFRLSDFFLLLPSMMLDKSCILSEGKQSCRVPPGHFLFLFSIVRRQTPSWIRTYVRRINHGTSPFKTYFCSGSAILNYSYISADQMGLNDISTVHHPASVNDCEEDAVFFSVPNGAKRKPMPST